MTLTQLAALGYALLTVMPAGVQVVLALGAPWGELTLGGRWPGRLPRAVRVLTLAQAVVLIGMALVVLHHGGLLRLPVPVPRAVLLASLGITALSSVANLATPSRAERQLWGPVTVAMLVLIATVTLRTT